MPFKPAVKQNAKLRFAISGPSGSGKTFTLLRLATELGGKVAYVDTEHGSASKYAHTPACSADCADPSHFTFDVIEPATFDPRVLMENIHEAVKGGYGAICIDSLSHYWMGPDGELEMVDNQARGSKSHNSFAAWKSVTPIHNRLVDLLLSAPIHVFVAMRTKTEWVLDKDKDGKVIPRKIGLTPVMRDGIEYEFDVCGDIDADNTLTVSKSRCPALTGKAINRPGPELAAILRGWLGSPDAAAPTPIDPVEEMAEHIGKNGGTALAFDFAQHELVEAMPDNGKDEYRRILTKHGIVAKGTNKTDALRAAFFEIITTARFAADQKAKTESETLFEDEPAGAAQ